MRIIWLALGYLLSVVILVFLGFSTWFVIVWGFNPVALFPLYVLELTIFGGVVLAHRAQSAALSKGANLSNQKGPVTMETGQYRPPKKNILRT